MKRYLPKQTRKVEGKQTMNLMSAKSTLLQYKNWNTVFWDNDEIPQNGILEMIDHSYKFFCAGIYFFCKLDINCVIINLYDEEVNIL